MPFNSTVYVVDDDAGVRSFVQAACASDARGVQGFASSENFVQEYDDSGETPRCLVLDVNLPRMSGLELHRRLVDSDALIAVLLLTGVGEIASAVESMRRGAVAFMEKPVSLSVLLNAVEQGLSVDAKRREGRRRRQALDARLQSLSTREREVFELLKDCKSNKQIAASLAVGFQTAAKHRASVFRKLNVGHESAFMQLLVQAANPSGIENLANDGSAPFAGEWLGQ